MISLGEDGLAKVKSGITTPEELLRVVTEVREMRTLCSGCGSAVGVDFKACPNCGKRLSGGCPHCGRALQPGWNFCPYCARSTETTRAQNATRRTRRSRARRRAASMQTSPSSRSKACPLKNYYQLSQAGRSRRRHTTR